MSMTVFDSAYPGSQARDRPHPARDREGAGAGLGARLGSGRGGCEAGRPPNWGASAEAVKRGDRLTGEPSWAR